jgi:hypothetical protein
MPSVLLDVPAIHFEAFTLTLSEEAFTYNILDSRDGAIETVITVEVIGSELQVAEAARLLPLMGRLHYVFNVSAKRLTRAVNIAKNVGLTVERTPVIFSFRGRPIFHMVEVSGLEVDLNHFKALK